MFDSISFQYSQVFVGFFFSERSNFSWFGTFIPSVMWHFCFSLLEWLIFMPNSMPLSWLNIFTSCIKVSHSFWFLVNSLMSSMHFRWFIFSCDLLSLYPPVHFLSMWLSSIIANTNSNGDSASHWNIPLWIFASAKFFPSAMNSTPQIFMVFLMKFMTSSDTLYILRQFIIQSFGSYHNSFCYKSTP